MKHREPYIGKPTIRVRAGTMRTDPSEARAHAIKLVDMGMTRNMIARAAGVTATSISDLLNQENKTMSSNHAAAILAVDGRPIKHQALVLGVGTRRRLQGLAACGWSLTQLGELLDVSPFTVENLRNSQRVSWLTYTRVRDVYDSLGNDGGSARTRSNAKRLGYVHPLLWDDIDDPAAVPTVDAEPVELDEEVVRRLTEGKHHSDATAAERKAAFAALQKRGLSATEIANLIGVSTKTIERYRAATAA